MRIASNSDCTDEKTVGKLPAFEKKARTRTLCPGARLAFQRPFAPVVVTVTVFQVPAGLPLTNGRVCRWIFALPMPQLFCMNDPDTAVAALPRTLVGLRVIASTGRFAGVGQPPVGAACEGGAGAMSSPPAMATVDTIWRARIADPPRVRCRRNVTACGGPVWHKEERGDVGCFGPFSVNASVNGRSCRRSVRAGCRHGRRDARFHSSCAR